MTIFNPQFKIATARGRIYSLLAALFSHPSRHPEPGEAKAILLRAVEALPPRLRSGKGAVADLKQLASETLRSRGAESTESLEYHALFGPGGTVGLNDVISEEALSFLNSPAIRQSAQERPGIAGSSDGHVLSGLIVSELEFMRCMAVAECECVMEERPAAAEMCQRKQLVFLQGRLLPWCRDFAVPVSPTSDFYRLLFLTTDLFCDLDARYLSLSLNGEARSNPSESRDGRSVSVDKNACSLCGVCERACANRALVVERDRGSIRLGFYQGRCDGCEACARSCPEKAVTIDARAPGAPDYATLLEKKLSPCPRCGEANDLAPLAGVALGRLGGDASSALRMKLSLCRRCREVGPSGRRRAAPAPYVEHTNVGLSSTRKDEVLQI